MPNLNQGFMPGEWDIQQQDISRQLKFADLLRQQAGEMPQGQMISGRYVAPSWTQQLAAALKGPMATYIEGQQNKRLAEGLRKEQERITGYGQEFAGIQPQGTGESQPIGERPDGSVIYGQEQTESPEQLRARQQAYLLSNPDAMRNPFVAAQAAGLFAAPKQSEGIVINGQLVDKYTGRPMGQAIPKQEEPFTLSPGALRFDAQGRPIAAAPKIENVQGVALDLNALQPGTVLPQNPNQPFSIGPNGRPIPNPAYQNYEITKAGAGAARNQVIMPQVEKSARIGSNEDFTKNVYRPTLEASKKNVSTLAQLDALDRLPISEQTGWGKEAQAKAAEVLVGLGYAGDQAKQLASNAQAFNAIRGKQVWEMLGQQKGPQTEGDAQRAQATYAQLGNTPQANKFINDFQRAVIKRQNAEAKFYREHYQEALNNGDLSQLERDWMASPEAQKSLFDTIDMSKWSKGGDVHSRAQAIISGGR